MQRIKSFENLSELCKKRKRSLSIDKIYSLKCEICGTDVINYEMCSGHHVYCSNDCFGIIYLRMLNNIQYQSFNDTDSMILDK